MSSHRYTVLDGMRGAAALSVLAYHADYGFYVFPTIPHGYLAVDFFFALSGFVLTETYDHRIALGMRWSSFMARRLVRLYPMILAGALLGALSFSPGWHGSLPELVMLNLSSITLLPFGLLFGKTTFPTNIPIWSLFFELAANTAFFASARHGTKHIGKTTIFLCTAAVILTSVAHLAGGLGAVGVNSVPSFLAGFARVAFSFGVGVAISRFAFHRLFPILPGWIPLLLLIILLAQPSHDWWYDMLCVVFCFPLLLCLGARATSSPKQDRIWLLAGALSYPIYVIQEPVLRAIFRLLGPGGSPALLGIMATIILATLLLRVYDEPLRARLALPWALPKSGT